MITKFLNLIFICISITIFAQSNWYFYEMKQKSDSTVANYRDYIMILDITPDEVKFYDYDYVKHDSINLVRNKDMKISLGSPIIKRKINSYKNTMFYSINQYYYSTKSEDIINWQLTNETKSEGGYNLQKAIAKWGGRSWIAWFCKEVPITEGPYKFHGLPGLIFEISDSGNNWNFKLIRSKKMDKTYNTINFVETFYGSKPITLTEQIRQEKLMEYYDNPVADTKEMFKNSNGQTKMMIGEKIITSLEDFREAATNIQNNLKKNNNPIEIDKAPKYK